MSKCNINYIGKFRNGSPKYWCKTHFAFAKFVGPEAPRKCKRHNHPKITEKDKFKLTPSDWEGGVGIWGALDPVYNTSPHIGHESGIHLHARQDKEGEKQIDYTFKELEIVTPQRDLFNKEQCITLNIEIAHAYTASMVFGKTMKYLTCPHCLRGHIDADFYAVTYHKKHMCTFCGRDFIDTERGISNPVVEIQRIFRSAEGQRSIHVTDRVLNINQKDYPGGIQIWGSNLAIIWTAERDEEAGIHVHVFEDSKGTEAFTDETFGRVIIDGIELNSNQVRYLMVQQSLSHLNEKVKAVNCPECKSPHFDTGDSGVRPHEHHLCEFCSHEFTTRIKCVGNPIIEKLAQLKINYELLQK